MNGISFNNALIKELRAITLMERMVAAGRTFIHLIHTDAEAQDLSASSKLNAEWPYLRMLFERGRVRASARLDAHFDAIGRSSSFDLETFFDDPRERPHLDGANA